MTETYEHTGPRDSDVYCGIRLDPIRKPSVYNRSELREEKSSNLIQSRGSVFEHKICL